MSRRKRPKPGTPRVLSDLGTGAVQQVGAMLVVGLCAAVRAVYESLTGSPSTIALWVGMAGIACSLSGILLLAYRSGWITPSFRRYAYPVVAIVIVLALGAGVYLWGRSNKDANFIASLDSIEPLDQTALFANLTLRNRGLPSAIEDWELSIWSPKLQIPSAPVSALPSTVTFQRLNRNNLDGPPTAVKPREKGLWGLTRNPVAAGAMVDGWLLFNIAEGVSVDALNKPGTIFIVTFRDVYGTRYSTQKLELSERARGWSDPSP